MISHKLLNEKKFYFKYVKKKNIKKIMETNLAGDSETSKSNFSSANEQKSIEIKHW